MPTSLHVLPSSSNITVLLPSQIGPAVVHLNMSFFFGNVLIVQTVVPEKPLLQRMTNSLYADWWLPSFVGYWILRAEGIQVNSVKNLIMIVGVTGEPQIEMCESS